MKATFCILAAALLGLSLASSEDLKLALGDREIALSQIEGGSGSSGPLLVSLHSNEKTAISAAKELLKSRSGSLYVLENGGERRMPVYSRTKRLTIDPNRIFSEAGVIRDLRMYSIFREDEARQCVQFGQDIIEKIGITKSRTVVALHNNTNGHFSLRSYLPGGSEAKATAMVHQGDEDEDNFFLVTEKHLFEALRLRGFNVVLQDNKNAPDDGSLSVYCGRHGIPYVNVEAENGDLTNQIRMLEALIDELEKCRTSAELYSALPKTGGSWLERVIAPRDVLKIGNAVVSAAGSGGE
jgi:hypothetical protein